MRYLTRSHSLIIPFVAVLCLFAQLLTAAVQPLPDGYLFTGLDGEIRQSTGGSYVFVFDKPVSTDKGSVKAGQEVELLPSSNLESIVRQMGDRPSISLRLWGTVTAYRGRNYIFPSYYLQVASPAPTSKPDADKSLPADTESQKNENIPVINDPNDEIRIPEELMADLKATRRVIDVAPAPHPQSAENNDTQPAISIQTPDAMVVDRSGIIIQAQDTISFRFDGVGRNVNLTSFHLLPCEVLQKMEAERKSSDLEPRRYRIAGIITRFKGDYYILPTRVNRAYSNGNFIQ